MICTVELKKAIKSRVRGYKDEYLCGVSSSPARLSGTAPAEEAAVKWGVAWQMAPTLQAALKLFFVALFTTVLLKLFS